jgi:tRNA(Ile)-lysidine synthase
VCVSGGRDSMVLLDTLSRIKRLKKAHLEVCHVDHRLREGSAADAAFVEQRCRSYGVRCHTEVLGPKPTKVNMEAWAREQRYAVFRRVARDRSLDLFLTAHTANDVAETMLIRLVANKELNSIEESDAERGCLRPLLDISRKQIDEYVERFGISFVEDPSNADTSLVRNRMRHHIIPFLEQQFDAPLVWTLSEQAQSLAQDAKALREWAQREAARYGDFQEKDPHWIREFSVGLAGLPPAVRWRVVEECFLARVGYRIGERLSSAVVTALLEGGDLVTVAEGIVVAGAGTELHYPTA